MEHKLIQNCKTVRFLLTGTKTCSKLVGVIEIEEGEFLKALSWRYETTNIPVHYLMKNYYAIIAILCDGYVINRVYRIISSSIFLYFLQIILSKKKKEER